MFAESKEEIKMMNGIALFLILTTLVTGSFFTPKPEDNIHNDDEQQQQNVDPNVIVMEGHRRVVVEFDQTRDGLEANTKVLISRHRHDEAAANHVDAAASSSSAPTARELVCDALGKCRHKIAAAMGKTREKVGEVEEGAKEVVSDAVRRVEEAVGGVGGKVKETARNAKDDWVDTTKTLGEDIESNLTRKLDQAREVTEEAVEAVKGGVEKVKEGGKSVAEKAVDAAKGGGKRVMEEGRETVDVVKGGAHKAKEKGREMAEKAADMVKGGASKAKEEGIEMAGRAADVVKGGAHKTKEEGIEMAERASDAVKGGAHKVKEEGKERAKGVGEMAEKAGEYAGHTVKVAIHKVKKRKQRNVSELYGKGKEVLRSMLKFLLWPDAMDSMLGVIHLLGFSAAFGMSMWVTFVSSYLLAEFLPRQQFGMLQSKMYPVYFRVQAYCIGVALIGHVLGHRIRFFSSRAEMFHGFNLLVSLLMALGNLLYLEPRATKVMYERIKVEKEDGRGRVTLTPPRSGIADSAGDPVSATTERQEEVEDKSRSGRLSERLQQLNRMSSFLNVWTLMSLSLHLLYLGQRVHVSR